MGRILYSLLLSISIPLFVQAQVIMVNDSSTAFNVCSQSAYFEDKSGKLDFKSVTQQSFTPNTQSIYQFSFTNSVFWFRFKIENKSHLNQNHWYALWDDGLNDHVDVYIPQSNHTYRILKGGLLTPAKEKAYTGLFPLYKLEILPKDSIQTYYVRVETSESLNGHLNLVTHTTYINGLPTTLALIWLMIGIELMRMLYNLILARYVRNTSFRWYTLHTFIVALSVLGSFGVTGNLFDKTPLVASFLNATFYLLMPATYTLFIYSILNVPKYFPKLKWVFWGIIAVSIIQVLSYFFVPRMYLLRNNNYLFLFTEAFLIFTSIYALIRRYPVNIYLMIPCFLTLIPFIFLNLRALGYLHYEWIYPMIYITNFMEIFALSLVLGRIIHETEREKLSTEKALLTEKLEAEKLVELDKHKTQFFANISHEFRTPLTLLLAPIEDLTKKYPKESYLPIMKRNAQRLLSLINQLLDISKLEARQMEPEIMHADLAKFIRSQTSAFSSLAQSRGIEFTVRQSHEQVDAYFDSDKLEKIMTNLLSNALKFTPKGGQLNIIVDYADDFKEVKLQVQDTGIGISTDKLAKIFDRFYQVDSSNQRTYEGTGIGLALVKELVEVLKGSIEVVSKEKAGTTFTVSFPIDYDTWKNFITDLPKEEKTPQITLSDTNYTSSTEQKIGDDNLLLIIDDNADIRAYIRSVFEGEYQIIEAIDGRDGLAKASEMMPDIVICDLMMPVLDGFGFCKALKTNDKINHIPVIMLTAKADLGSKIEGFDLGADDYVTKPFNTEEIKARVDNLVKQRELLRAKFEIKVVDLKPTELKVNSQEAVFIQKIKEILEQHIADSTFDLDKFTEAINLSPYQLRRKLKAITGLNPVEFIRKYRLQKSAELLKQNAGSVSEVAYMVGFESLSYFTKTFQEEFGVIPSEYF